MFSYQLKSLFYISIFCLEIGVLVPLMRSWQPVKVQAVTTPTCLQSYVGSETKIFSSKANFVTFIDCMFDNSDMQAHHTNVDNLKKSEEQSFGTNHVLSAYLDLYEMTGNDKYLQKFTEIMDKLINLTDQKQKLSIFTGESLPTWGRDSYLTLSYPKVLFDQNGQPSLEIKAENWAHNQTIRVEIIDGSTSNKFKIKVKNNYPLPQYDSEYISSDKTIADFGTNYPAVGNSLSYIKIKRLGNQRPKNVVIPELETKRQLNTHNTGDIAGLLARYAYLSPNMSANYKSKASLYKQVAIDAVYTHDTIGEWVDKGNYGYYIWNSKGAFYFDGYVQPYNYTAAMGTAFDYLYRTSQGAEKEKYRDRLDKMAKGMMYCEPNFPSPTSPPAPTPKTSVFYPCMTYVPNGNKYVWPYGYLNSYYKYNMPVETLSYAPLDLNFIYLLTEDGFLSSQDSTRFANTVYDMVQTADQTPPTLAANVLSAQLGTVGTTDGVGGLVRAPWGMVPFAKFRKDIFTKTAALYSGLPLNKYYNTMSGYSRFYSAMTQTAITAEKNGYWPGSNSPTLTPTPNNPPTSSPTPTTRLTTTPVPTSTPTSRPTVTPTTLITNTPTPTSTIAPTALPSITPNPGECNKTTDLNSDGITDLTDASDVIAALGQSGENLPEDLNCDLSVDLTDFLMVVEKLGT